MFCRICRTFKLVMRLIYILKESCVTIYTCTYIHKIHFRSFLSEKVMLFILFICARRAEGHL